jgi:hypothetical protein
MVNSDIFLEDEKTEGEKMSGMLPDRDFFFEKSLSGSIPRR